MDQEELVCEQDVFNLLTKAIGDLYRVEQETAKSIVTRNELKNIIRDLEKYRRNVYDFDIRWDKVEIDEP